MLLTFLFLIKTFTVAGRQWSIDVPAAYTQQATNQPDAQSSSVAFMPDPRPGDKTRPMIQVTTTTNAGDLETFAYAMIKGVQKRREEWNVTKSDIKLGDVHAIRYEWSGVVVAPNDVRLHARGILIAGMNEGVAFSLHAQDVDPYAAQTLPIAEKAMQTFKIVK